MDKIYLSHILLNNKNIFLFWFAETLSETDGHLNSQDGQSYRYYSYLGRLGRCSYPHFKHEETIIRRGWHHLELPVVCREREPSLHSLLFLFLLPSHSDFFPLYLLIIRLYDPGLLVRVLEREILSL